MGRYTAESIIDAKVVAYIRDNFGKKAADAYAERLSTKRVSQLKSRKRLRSRRAS